MAISLTPSEDPNLKIGPGGGLWRVDGDSFKPLMETHPPREFASYNGGTVEMPLVINHRDESLAIYLEAEPSFLGEPLLVIGRHVPYDTDNADTIDILALDENSVIHVIAVEQTQATSSTIVRVAEHSGWVREVVGVKELQDIFGNYRTDVPLEQAFLDAFERSFPNEITGRRMVIVAGDIDGTVEDSVEVGQTEARRIRAVTFREYKDSGGMRILVQRSLPGREMEIYVRRGE